MKQYSIFYIENGRIYPVFQKGDEFFLGGGRLSNLLFSSRKLAEKTARTVRSNPQGWTRNGKIQVMRAEIIAISR